MSGTLLALARSGTQIEYQQRSCTCILRVHPLWQGSLATVMQACEFVSLPLHSCHRIYILAMIAPLPLAPSSRQTMGHPPHVYSLYDTPPYAPTSHSTFSPTLAVTVGRLLAST